MIRFFNLGYFLFFVCSALAHSATDCRLFLVPSTSADFNDYPFYVKAMQALVARSQGLSMFSIGESTGVLLSEETIFRTYQVSTTTPKPIYVLKYEPPRKMKGQIVVVAGHHAVETAGPVSALNFLEYLLHSSEPLARTVRAEYGVVVVPVVDVDHFSVPFEDRIYSVLTNHFYNNIEDDGPLWKDEDGYKKALRAGSEAKSIAIAVSQWILEAPSFLAFDLHENGPPDKPNFISTSVFSEGYEKYKNGFLVIPANGLDEPDYIECARSAMKAEGMDWVPSPCPIPGNKTFTDYAARLGGIAFLFESPRYRAGNRSLIVRPDEERMRMHVTAMKAMVSNFIRQLPLLFDVD